MSRVFGIRHTSSGSTSHGSDTRRRHSERPEDEVRGKADSSTNELKNNRYTKGAGGRRPPAPFVGAAEGRPLCFLPWAGGEICSKICSSGKGLPNCKVPDILNEVE